MQKLNPFEPSRLDPVVEANRALLHQRSQVGIGKYGVTLHEGGYKERQLVVHALEEALDLANYLQALLQKIDRDKPHLKELPNFKINCNKPLTPS